MNIPEAVESIGYHVFSGCRSLQSVMILESVKCIGSKAFSHCTSLQSVFISQGVKSIGHGAFASCRALNLIILPDVLVDNRSQYGITANQIVIKYSDFIEWKRKNGLEGKSYPDRVILFLYQLQNTESFKPSWSEVLKQCPEVAVADLLKFSDKKPTCLPELFWGNSSCDVEDKMADAEQCNHRFKVSIDANEYPGFADSYYMTYRCLMVHLFSVQPKIKIFVLINQVSVQMKL